MPNRQRIQIYRAQDGLCQVCLKKGLPEDEARVSWGRYQADHIIAWIKGGRTEDWNGQVLCTTHNTAKGAGGLLVGLEQVTAEVRRVISEIGER